MYLGQKNGREASLFVGVHFNEENPDTNYKSGTQFHLDGTLAQHFPAFGGLASVGVSAYYYKQLTGDSGDGATLGDFEGKPPVSARSFRTRARSTRTTSSRNSSGCTKRTPRSGFRETSSG